LEAGTVTAVLRRANNSEARIEGWGAGLKGSGVARGAGGLAESGE